MFKAKLVDAIVDHVGNGNPKEEQQLRDKILNKYSDKKIIAIVKAILQFDKDAIVDRLDKSRN